MTTLASRILEKKRVYEVFLMYNPDGAGPTTTVFDGLGTISTTPDSIAIGSDVRVMYNGKQYDAIRNHSGDYVLIGGPGKELVTVGASDVTIVALMESVKLPDSIEIDEDCNGLFVMNNGMLCFAAGDDVAAFFNGKQQYGNFRFSVRYRRVPNLPDSH